MWRGEEELRMEAVRRRLAGESPRRIARSLGRSRRWVAKWVARYQPTDEAWATGRKPGRAVNRTDAALEAQVVAVRSRLSEDPWA
ncbi:MAG: helix-turn-helix domain-containing protein, partial [Pseudonocardiaceae bacterium]